MYSMDEARPTENRLGKWDECFWRTFSGQSYFGLFACKQFISIVDDDLPDSFFEHTESDIRKMWTDLQSK